MTNFKKLVSSVLVVSSILMISSCSTDVLKNIAENVIATSLSDISIEKVAEIDATPLALEKNMARLNGLVVNVSSTYEGWPKERLVDGKIDTSWFTEVGDAANLGKSPYVELVFPQPITLEGVNFRGNREYKDGYDILEGILTITSKTGDVYKYTITFPQPDRDFNVKLKKELSNITSVKLTFTKDESTEPGFAEIEVLGKK